MKSPSVGLAGRKTHVESTIYHRVVRERSRVDEERRDKVRLGQVVLHGVEPTLVGIACTKCTRFASEGGHKYRVVVDELIRMGRVGSNVISYD